MMCDERTEAENQSMLSRRDFSVAAGAAGFVALLPQTANAMAVSDRDVTIKTPDGEADAYFVAPAKGKHPAILIWPDIRGLRPAFRQMAKRLAESGYAVLCVNPFYRDQKAPVVTPAEQFSDPNVRQRLFAMAGKLNATTHMSDAKAMISFLDAQPEVNRKRKIGTIGYCMGGPMTIRTAAAVPQRVGAIGSFHGGGLASDKPDSPHLLIPRLTISALIAIADNDDKADPKAKDILRSTFDAAKLPAEIEVYQGAMHGWCPPDGQAYHQVQAEKAWSRMLVIFGKAL